MSVVIVFCKMESRRSVHVHCYYPHEFLIEGGGIKASSLSLSQPTSSDVTVPVADNPCYESVTMKHCHVSLKNNPCYELATH